MKKTTLILALAALAAVSCNPPGSDDAETERTGYNLAVHTEEIMRRFAMGPAEDLEFLLTLDGYQKLSSEEQNQAEWEEFKSMILHYSDTEIKVVSKGIIINTDGRPLTETGSRWTVTVEDEYRHIISSDYIASWLPWDRSRTNYSGKKTFVCVAENQYEIHDESAASANWPLTLSAARSEDGGFEFAGSGYGEIREDEHGISAKYDLNEFVYSKGMKTLNMRLETFLYGKPLDWCELVMTKDNIVKAHSNLEIKTPPVPLE